MRGTVFHYDEDQDFGYINGADGKRYIFAREDLSQHVALVRGTPVEFRPDDGTAHDIVAAASPVGGMAASGADQPQHFGRLAETEPVGPAGLWTYFRRALRENHVNFTGRARRKEFWGFFLYWTIVLIVTSGLALLINAALSAFSGNLDISALGYIVPFIFMLVTVIPSFALIVRRLHDVGLTGWLALLCYVPAFGGLALLVFGLIPSETGQNQWGAVPAGVKI
ncbi:DUF805 domain-containing protein [Mesorhizobium sp.]|uniref:DUF805 domain-containing protein n=1 Tax=Mesorhizobium sp. TaxID=1871066 RepID=UPI001224F6CD|nr:DUF805 domain-containing protein [Mesorhizobium sp.]TIS98910.1 MAG: DUF805 domain-containing protein [Mesorhizobium sp.]